MVELLSLNSEVQSNRFNLEYEYIGDLRKMVQDRSNLIDWIIKDNPEFNQMQAVDYFEKVMDKEEDYINEFFTRFLKDYHKDRT